MTDTPENAQPAEPPPPPPLPDADDVVGRTVERAAEKVAEAAAAKGPVANGHPVLGRMESIVVVVALLAVNLGNLWVAIDARNDGRRRASDIRIVCELLSKTPDVDVAKVAECLK